MKLKDKAIFRKCDGSCGHGGEGGALLFCRSKKRASKQIGKPWTDLFVKRRAGGGALADGGFLVLFCGRKKNKTLFLTIVSSFETPCTDRFALVQGSSG